MILSVSSSFSLAVLRNGSNGYNVTLVQRLLNNAGYGSLVEDGIFGVSTDAAVKQFQRDRSLTVDGIVGSQTWEALLPPTIRRGSSGDDVKGLQMILNQMGYASLVVDGIFGSHTEADVERLQMILNQMGYGSLVVDGIFASNTEAAVKGFQQNRFLEVDGIVGQNTWYALMRNMI